MKRAGLRCTAPGGLLLWVDCQVPLHKICSNKFVTGNSEIYDDVVVTL